MANTLRQYYRRLLPCPLVTRSPPPATGHRFRPDASLTLLLDALAIGRAGTVQRLANVVMAELVADEHGLSTSHSGRRHGERCSQELVLLGHRPGVASLPKGYATVRLWRAGQVREGRRPR